MNIQKITSCIIMILIMSCSTQNIISNQNKNEYKIFSPDKTLELNITLDDGLLNYSLKKNNQVIIDPSLLGIKSDVFDLTSKIKIKKVDQKSTNQTWEQVWGEQKTIIDNNNEIALTIVTDNNDLEMTTRFKLFNDGLGFRYEIEEQNDIKNYNIL